MKSTSRRVPAPAQFLALATLFELQPEELFEISALSQGGSRTLVRSNLAFADNPEGCARLAAMLAWGLPDDGTAKKGGLYLGPNPLRRYLRARPSDADVVTLRWLLIDADPAEDTSAARRASRDLTRRLVGLLRLVCPGVRLVVIGSGRGVQIWLRHAERSGDDEQMIALRKRLVDGLAALFQGGLAHVDTSASNPSRLGRLPWTSNLRSGRVARLIGAHGSRPLSFADMAALVAMLPASISGPSKRGRALPVVPGEGTPEQFRALCDGCPHFAEGYHRQAGGGKWHRPVWMLWAGVAVPKMGAYGMELIRGLDESAMGQQTSIPDDLFTSAPTSCRRLVEGLASDPSYPQHLRDLAVTCGTPNNVCGFAKVGDHEPSPWRHAEEAADVPPPVTADPVVVRAAIRARLAQPIAAGDALLVLGGCGAGKSSEALDLIVRDTERPFLLVVPTHELAREVEAKLVGLGVVDVVRLVGQDEVCRPPSEILARIKTARALGVPAAVCDSCRLRPTCAYPVSKEKAGAARVVVAATARLASRRLMREIGSDRTIVVDEDPSAVLAPRRAYTLDDLGRALDLARQSVYAAVPGFEPPPSPVEPVLSWLLGLIAGSGPGVRAVTAAEVPTDSLLLKIPHTAIRDLEMTAAVDGYPISLSDVVAWCRHVALMRRASPQTVVALVDHSQGSTVVTIGWRVRLPRKAPIVLLDATGDREVVERLVGRQVEVVGEPTRSTTAIVQFFDVASSAFALQSPGHPGRTQALDVVRAVAAKHPGAALALVTTKTLEAESSTWGVSWSMTGHFGAARGVNRFRGSNPPDFGIVVATHRPPEHVVRSFALFVLGARVEDVLVGGSIRWLRVQRRRVRTWGWDPAESPVMAKAEGWLVRNEAVQAVGRLVGAQMIYVVSDQYLGLGEDLVSAGHYLGVAIPDRPAVGRPPIDLARLVEVARGLATPCAKTVAAAARTQGLKCSDRSVRRHWPQIEAQMTGGGTR